MNKLLVLILAILVLVFLIFAILKFDLVNRWKNSPGYTYDLTNNQIDYSTLTNDQVKDLCGEKIGFINFVGTYGNRQSYIHLYESGKPVVSDFYIKGTNNDGILYMWRPFYKFHIFDLEVGSIKANLISVLPGIYDSLNEPQKSQLMKIDQSKDCGSNQLFKKVAK